MMTFESLSAHPRAFLSLSGLSLADFEALSRDFAAAYAQDRQRSLTRKKRQPRRRAAGAGAKFSHDGRTHLPMALVWLRVYPTYEVLGFLFRLNKGNAQRGVVDVLDTLAAHTVFTCERPAKERQKLRSVQAAEAALGAGGRSCARCRRQKLRSVQAVMDAFPDVRLVIDAKEQRVRRPGGSDEKGDSRQKPFYSGKKKAHTLKTQVAVSPDGQFQSVSHSVPGSAHDLTLLRQGDLMQRLTETEAAMMDKGYDGITTTDPKAPDKNGPPRTCYLPHKARRGHPLTDEQKAYNAHLSRYRIIVEHSLAQINQFQALAQVYRHRRGGHSTVTRVVAGLVNRRIAQRPLRTYPAACAAA